MALIYIRARREPIEIENERARKIKALRFGDINGENKADPSEMIDLGDAWAGELGRIVAVEMTKVEKSAPKYDPNKEMNEYIASQRKLPIKERAAQLARFKMSWWSRSGMKEKEPPQAVLAEALKLSLDYYKEHPDAYEVPMSILEPVLVKYWGSKIPETLAEKKKLSTD